MRALSASEIVAVWERGCTQHPVDRALTLLEACCGDSRDHLALFSIGRRDGLLLLVHQQLFGDALQAFAECPQCGQHLEYSLSARDVGASSLQPHEEAPLLITGGEMQLQLRLPNSFDLGAVAAYADASAARRLLAERCVVHAKRAGLDVPTPELTDSVVSQIADRLATADPQAEILIDLTCIACCHAWQVVLETESFLWMKVSALAKRLLRDVHILAREYGWSEQQILSLNPRRRQAYLEMVG
jgi:hypothetical protein